MANLGLNLPYKKIRKLNMANANNNLFMFQERNLFMRRHIFFLAITLRIQNIRFPHFIRQRTFFMILNGDKAWA